MAGLNLLWIILATSSGSESEQGSQGKPSQAQRHITRQGWGCCLPGPPMPYKTSNLILNYCNVLGSDITIHFCSRKHSKPPQKLSSSFISWINWKEEKLEDNLVAVVSPPAGLTHWGQSSDLLYVHSHRFWASQWSSRSITYKHKPKVTKYYVRIMKANTHKLKTFIIKARTFYDLVNFYLSNTKHRASTHGQCI